MGSAAVAPEVDSSYERQFVYVYGTVSPLQGGFGLEGFAKKMNTEEMDTLLAQVSQAHAEEFIFMVVDGFQLPLLSGPGYSRVAFICIACRASLRNSIRKSICGTSCAKKEFPNRVFDSLDGGSLAPSNQACHDWLPIALASAV